jgi:hypothetical protein
VDILYGLHLPLFEFKKKLKFCNAGSQIYLELKQTAYQNQLFFRQTYFDLYMRLLGCPQEQKTYNLNIYIYWDMTSCNPLKVNGYFVGTSRLHLQDRRISQARTKNKLKKTP